MDTWEGQAPRDAEIKTLPRKGDTVIMHWARGTNQASWFPLTLSQETCPKILQRLLSQSQFALGAPTRAALIEVTCSLAGS